MTETFERFAALVELGIELISRFDPDGVREFRARRDAGMGDPVVVTLDEFGEVELTIVRKIRE